MSGAIHNRFHIHICRRRSLRALTRWPSQDIRSLKSFIALVHHSGVAPSICIAHTIATLLHDECAIYDPHPTPLVYAIHHTILAVEISCKGQLTRADAKSLRSRAEPDAPAVSPPVPPPASLPPAYAPPVFPLRPFAPPLPPLLPAPRLFIETVSIVVHRRFIIQRGHAHTRTGN